MEVFAADDYLSWINDLKSLLKNPPIPAKMGQPPTL
jgi:hypothetical protein